MAFQESFLFLSADLAIPPVGDDTNEVGTVFIYEPQPLFNATEFAMNNDSVEIENSSITGTCTRTLSATDTEGGGGVCDFSLNSDGAQIILSGFIEDYVAGVEPPTLVITGGNDFNTGIRGTVTILPLDENGQAFEGDIFFDAFGYQAVLDGVMLVCDIVEV